MKRGAGHDIVRWTPYNGGVCRHRREREGDLADSSRGCHSRSSIRGRKGSTPPTVAGFSLKLTAVNRGREGISSRLGRFTALQTAEGVEYLRDGPGDRGACLFLSRRRGVSTGCNGII